MNYSRLLLLQESVVVNNANWRLTVCALYRDHFVIQPALQAHFLHLEGTLLALAALRRSEPEHKALLVCVIRHNLRESYWDLRAFPGTTKAYQSQRLAKALAALEPGDVLRSTLLLGEHLLCARLCQFGVLSV